MLFSAKNGRLHLDGAHMDYIRFGTGSHVLLLLPGLGDGLQTVKGTALPMAWMYRQLAGDFTVYMFSRRQPLPDAFTTRDMARDLSIAMDALGIPRAHVAGVSMGGMIAQYLALDYPERVERLVLTVTCCRPNPILTGSVEEWVGFARAGNHTALMDSNVRRIYSAEYYRKSKWLIPVMGVLTKPRSYRRFLIQARACVTHDAWDRLPALTCPTLVIGGLQDKALGGEASRELAQQIPGARLKLYDHWGHGLYEEAPDFLDTVADFLLRESV